MHESNAVQEAPGLGDRVLEGEALREIHFVPAPGSVLDAGWVVQVEERLIAEGDAEGRFPACQLAEGTSAQRQLIGVEERKTCLELPREGTP